MKETFYFSHDYNASQDPKIMAILSTCGLAGVGMYWILIEILHQQPESKILYKSYEDYIEFYGRIDGENEHLLNNIKEMLISVGLFIKEDEYIISKRVLNNKKERERLSELRSIAGKKSAEIRAKSTSVEHVLNKGQQGKEIKGKERKENIILADANNKFSSVGDILKWQVLAQDILSYLKDGEEKKSSVYKCCKDDERTARMAFDDCKELGKPNVMYFLKVYNDIRKKQI